VKTINVRDFQKRIRSTVDIAQEEGVVLTRHGEPVALVVGLEGMDWEDVLLQTSRSFWKMIQTRRKQKTIPLREMRDRLELGERKRARSRTDHRKG
jgi:antitoxin (DNA-binding transcriptional repressor) of toxin-antitoxin stability system